MEGHGVPLGGILGVGVHVAHTPREHGAAEMASLHCSDLLVLGAAHGGRYLDTVVGQGAELGPRWRRRGGLPRSAPRASHHPAVDYVPAHLGPRGSKPNSKGT